MCPVNGAKHSMNAGCSMDVGVQGTDVGVQGIDVGVQGIDVGVQGTDVGGHHGQGTSI